MDGCDLYASDNDTMKDLHPETMGIVADNQTALKMQEP